MYRFTSSLLVMSGVVNKAASGDTTIHGYRSTIARLLKPTKRVVHIKSKIAADK